MITRALTIQRELAWALVVVSVAATVALIVSPQLAFFLLLFAVLGWWTWHNPTPAFGVLVVISPFLPMLKITQTLGLMTLMKDVIIITLFLRLVFVPLLQRRLPYRRNMLLAPIFALLVWVAVALARADVVTLGILRTRDIGLYILAYFAVLYLPRKKMFWRSQFWLFIMSAIVVAGLAIWQWFMAPDSAVLRFDPARAVWIPRASSIMAHPSVLGEYMVMVVGLLASVMIVLAGWWRVVSAGAIIVLFPLIYLTYSRAVWIALVVGLGVLGVVYIWKIFRDRGLGRRLVWTTLSVVLVGVLMFLIGLRTTSLDVFIRSAVDPTYGSNFERLEFMARLISPLQSGDAIIGMGLGDVLQQNFRTVEINTFDIASGADRSVQLAKNSTLVDNQYLKTFIEMGLIGLIIYGWLFWRMARGAWWLVMTDGSGPRRVDKIIGLWAIGFLAAFVTQALFIDIWDIFPTNLAWWVIAGLVSRQLIGVTQV